jgi:hypothetical protein
MQAFDELLRRPITLDLATLRNTGPPPSADDSVDVEHYRTMWQKKREVLLYMRDKIKGDSQNRFARQEVLRHLRDLRDAARVSYGLPSGPRAAR